MLEEKKKLIVVRSNTRILPSQKEYIEKMSKKTKYSEGHIIREIIQSYMDKNPL